MKLTPNMEDYLEAILEINREKSTVRVKDVSKKLGVTMPSVNGALKTLEKKGLVKHEKYEYIELTPEGQVHAAVITSRHRLLFTFLNTVLGVETETAEEEACKLEHILSTSTLNKVSEFIDKHK